MNKERFMIELERLLRGLPSDEREDALNYYREYIEDAGFSDRDDVTDKLGTPKQVARSILGESVEKHVEVQREKKDVRSGASTLWRILLYICAAPFAIPVVAVVAALFIALVAVVFSVGVALVCSGGAMIFAGIILIPAVFWSLTTPQVMIVIGAILVLIPLGVIWCIGCYKVCGVMLKAVAGLARKMFVRKER